MRVATTLGLAVLLLALPVARSHDAVVTIPDPGFRPESARESQFLNDIGAASIAVYPTLLRRIDRTAHSSRSQAQVISFLDAQGIGNAEAASRRLDPGRLDPRSQWLIFQEGLAALAEAVPGSHNSADYHLLLEILVPGDDAVFGIEVYLVDMEGENAFSFLLNAHHQVFAAAELRAGESQAARDAMIDRATAAAMRALAEQLTRAQACAVPQQARTPTRLTADFVDDFETGLRTGADPDGIALGFSTFSGDKSRARVATTKMHPPVPGHAKGNSVLQVDLDVTTWAGVLHRFANDNVDQWVSYDLSDAKELSFWLHGRDSGTTLVIDVLDNRRSCPHLDDAERYSYQFVDDFSGWRLLSIPFAVMQRKEIWNAAPNDGLGLCSVNGWAFAALKTRGEATYFIDDVRLRRVPLLESIPQGLSPETDIWVPINELPMYGGYEKTAFQADADQRFLQMVLPRFAGDRAAAAEYFARTGWNLYYRDDRPSAIKRFNQAWLLDPGNQKALWGFAVISRERGQTEGALRFYRLALEAGPTEPTLQQEYESLRREARE